MMDEKTAQELIFEIKELSRRVSSLEDEVKEHGKRVGMLEAKTMAMAAFSSAAFTSLLAFVTAAH